MLKFQNSTVQNWGYNPVESALVGNYNYTPTGYMTPGQSIYDFSGVNSGSGLGMSINGLSKDNFWSPDNNTTLGKNLGSDSGFGWNLGTAKMGVDAIAAIGGLYSALQSNKLAKKQFDFTKEITNTNLNNQIKTLNTSMEGRARARARLNGEADPEAYTREYMDKNRLTRG